MTASHTLTEEKRAFATQLIREGKTTTAIHSAIKQKFGCSISSEWLLAQYHAINGTQPRPIRSKRSIKNAAKAPQTDAPAEVTIDVLLRDVVRRMRAESIETLTITANGAVRVQRITQFEVRP